MNLYKDKYDMVQYLLQEIGCFTPLKRGEIPCKVYYNLNGTDVYLVFTNYYSLKFKLFKNINFGDGPNNFYSPNSLPIFWCIIKRNSFGIIKSVEQITGPELLGHNPPSEVLFKFELLETLFAFTKINEKK